MNVLSFLLIFILCGHISCHGIHTDKETNIDDVWLRFWTWGNHTKWKCVKFNYKKLRIILFSSWLNVQGIESRIQKIFQYANIKLGLHTKTIVFTTLKLIKSLCKCHACRPGPAKQVPNKYIGTCQYWPDNGPMLPASAQYRTSTGN